MSDIEPKKCTDCGATVKRIQILDKTIHGHVLPEYAVGDAERGRWTAKYPIEGRVASYMCDQCGRIYLYGEQK